MTINTKYNPGQEVWIMKNNKALKLFVHAITIVASMNNDKKIVYGILYNLANGSEGGNFDENNIYATKEDLKNSIFK